MTTLATRIFAQNMRDIIGVFTAGLWIGILVTALFFGVLVLGLHVGKWCYNHISIKKLSHIDKAITRAVWGFIAYIPFCYFWGVDNFTLFSFLGTLYFVPVHWIYDKVMKHG